MTTTTYFGASILKILTGATERLEAFAQHMPNGDFVNLHNNQHEQADAIGIQLDGKVVLLSKHSVCSINPLVYLRQDDQVYLHTCSCGGTFVPNYNFKPQIDWEVSIDRYNNDLSTYSYEKCLIAVYDFAAE